MAFGPVGIEDVLIVAILIAVVAFLYSNLGLGGGALYVPIMVLFFGDVLEMKEIVPLSLCFAFVTMLSSTYSHNRKGLVDFRLGIYLALAGLLGVVAGVAFTLTAIEEVIKAGFAILLVIVATKMMRDLYRERAEPESSPRSFGSRQMLGGMGISILTGFLVGSFGIGGGVVSVPLVIYVFKVQTRRAIGTSAMMGAILTPAAFVAYVLNESVSGGFEIHWDLALLLTPIVFVLALLGSRWGLEKLRTRVVKAIFIGGVYLAGAVMVYSLLSM